MPKSRSGSTSGGDAGGAGDAPPPATPPGGGTAPAAGGSSGKGGAKKHCEECGDPSPVACRACTSCGADFYSDRGHHHSGGGGGADRDRADSPAGGDNDDDYTATVASVAAGERRRSERVKREKPDYYDALDFEHKTRKSTPTRPRRERTAAQPAGMPAAASERSEGGAISSKAGRSPKVKEERRGRPPGSGASGGGGSASGRATLTWKKGGDDDDDERDRRRRKRPRHSDLESVHMMDELTSEKGLQCRVTLAEINRKLGFVMMGQPR